MTIGVDAGCLGIKDERLKVGVYQVAKNLFEQLAKFDTQNTYLLYSFYPIEKSLLKSFGENSKNIVVKPARGWTKIWLPLQLLRDKPDVFIGLNQSLPLKLPLQKYKSIVMIHDLLFEEYPKLYPGSFRKLHKESKSATKLADAIIVPSNATKREVEKYYKIPEEKIIVIYEGVRKFEKGAGSRVKPGMTISSYFLYVGALKPQKNVPMLLNAFSRIVNPHPNPPPENKGEGEQGIALYIVGGDKWKDKEIDRAFKKLPKTTQERIHFLGTVDESTLAKLYRNATAFVSPSLSEGFGLTFLESLSFGVPVIGPKTGAVPEVVGDAGILVDPTNTDELELAMRKMLNKKVREKFQKKAKEQARKFSWKLFARRFLRVLDSLRSPEHKKNEILHFVQNDRL